MEREGKRWRERERERDEGEQAKKEGELVIMKPIDRNNVFLSNLRQGACVIKLLELYTYINTYIH